MTQSPDNKDQEKDIFANIPKTKVPPGAKEEPTPLSALPQQSQSSQGSPQHSRGEKSLRALWTITALISMTVNVVVIALLIFLFQTYSESASTFELPPGIGVETPKDFLQGLYDNFQLMDEAHIKTDIVVADTIPVQFALNLNQQTDVILSQDVTIYGAYVSIDTALIDINAPATVMLPKGTVLPIVLDLVVPVDTTIPIELHVPVDIPLEETDLHTPFAALKEVVRPLYCLVAPDVLSTNGEAVCP